MTSYIGLRLTPAHNGEDRGPSRTTAPDPTLVRDGPRTNPLWAGVNGSTCAVCGELMTLVEAGQTTHPNCEETRT
jgi:hypothetical protein